MFRVTSIRRGFVGGGFEGSRSLPKQHGDGRRRPGRGPHPRDAELFLGFTSTQKAGLGPTRIANFETLGYVDLRASEYFEQGTHMHLSHLFEDLEAWYLNFDHRERVDTTFRPGLEVPVQTLTVPARAGRRPDAGRRLGGLRGDAAHRPQRLDPAVVEAHRGRQRARRDALREGHGDPAASGLQHARQPVLLDGDQGPRPLRARAGRGSALRRVQPVERRLPAQPAGDGRRPARRDGAAVRAALARPGLQRGAPDDAPPELPRAAARAPLVPARRAEGVTDRWAPASRSPTYLCSTRFPASFSLQRARRARGMVEHVGPAVALERQLAALRRRAPRRRRL